MKVGVLANDLRTVLLPQPFDAPRGGSERVSLLIEARDQVSANIAAGPENQHALRYHQFALSGESDSIATGCRTQGANAHFV